jgi:hypothetical protein
VSDFPTSLDVVTIPAGTAPLSTGSHRDIHEVVSSAVEAVEAKLGTGASTPTSGTVLTGTGVGTSAWQAASGGSGVLLHTATYDFAVDGGAIGSVEIGDEVPENAIVYLAGVDVITALDSATDAATVTVSLESPEDISAGQGSAYYTAGIYSSNFSGTFDGAPKLASPTFVTLTIADEALTAGKFRVFLQYVLSE